MSSASVAAGFSRDVAGTDMSLGLNADLVGLKLVIAPGEGDSFLREIIGDNPVVGGRPGRHRVEEGKGPPIQRERGVRGDAASARAARADARRRGHREDSLPHRTGRRKFGLELGAAVSGQLGPLQFMLDGVGVDTNVAFQAGNAGPFDIALGFKPPNGAGLAIEGGGFTGGGFLIFDRAERRVRGRTRAEVRGAIRITALGIVSTRMPDGSAGFSLLIVIASEIPPIQLPFGFMLRRRWRSARR